MNLRTGLFEGLGEESMYRSLRMPMLKIYVPVSSEVWVRNLPIFLFKEVDEKSTYRSTRMRG